MILLALVPLVTFRQLVYSVGDPDIFWHLRMGEYVLGSWTFSGPDPFSAYASEPLLLHEWPLEVVYALVQRLWGFPGLVVLQALGAALLLAALYYLVRREAAPLLAAPVAVLAWLGTSGTFALRPQMASFILLALVTRAWLQTADDGRARWWLVPLSWVWAVTHGLWVSGAGVALLVVAGMVLDEPRRWRRLRGPALAAAGSWIVAGLTPLGPTLLVKPFGQASEYAAFVTEWDPPPLFTVHSLCTIGLLVLTMVVWARSARRPSWARLLLWLAALGAALLYSRTVAVGAVIAAPLAARALADVLPSIRSQLPRPRLEVVVMGLGVAGLAIAAILAAPRLEDHNAKYPTGLNDELSSLPAGSRVLNAYELGGWLLWTHPELSPYVDGRADVYSVDHLRRYAVLLSTSPGWQKDLAEDQVDVALLPATSQLAASLQEAGWTVDGSAAGYSLLAAPKAAG